MRLQGNRDCLNIKFGLEMEFMQKKTNILFLFADDQRFDTLHALNNPYIITPNLDRLVENGATFTQAHIPCGTCGAVCMPSRAMLHSGRTLFHLQGEGQEIPREHITLGETLKQAGYRAFGTGKWHNGTDAYTRSFTEGKSVYFGGMGDHWNVPACDYCADYNYPTRKVCMKPHTSNKVTIGHAQYIEFGKHSTDLFAEKAVEFLQQYDSEDPFFMYVSFMAPHDPRTMPEEYLRMYDDVDVPLPENFREEHEFDYGIKNLRDESLAPYPRTKENTIQQIKEYYAMITHIDAQVGNIMKVLQEKGLAEDTIIIFSGDNGLALGRHGLFGKQNCYEHSIRVPLIYAGPGIPKGELRDTYVYLLDIYPTICELLGIDVPNSVEGISMAKAIYDPDYVVREDLYFAFRDILRSVKNDQFKLIEYRTDKVNRTQLFDLKNDPFELTNLYGMEQYSEVVEELRALLLQYRDMWDDCKHPLGKKFWERYEEKV